MLAVATLICLAGGAGPAAAGTSDAAPAGEREQAKTDAGADRKTRVLFVGNSLTFWHDIPKIIADLAANDGTDFQVEQQMIKSAATSVGRFWKTRKGDIAGWRGQQAKKLIKAGGWDFVVLQPYPDLSDEEAEAVRQFHKLIDASGARLVLYMTPGKIHEGPLYEDVDEKRQFIAAERARFAKLAKELDALVVPAMEASWNAKHADPTLDLRTPVRSFGNVHSSPIEAYLVACTFYTVLSGQSPVGNPMRHVDADKKFHPVDTNLDAETAKWLQAHALKAVRDYHKEHGIGEGYTPPPLDVSEAELTKPAHPDLTEAQRREARAALRIAIARGYLADVRRRAKKNRRVEKKYLRAVLGPLRDVEKMFPDTEAAKQVDAIRAEAEAFRSDK